MLDALTGEIDRIPFAFNAPENYCFHSIPRRRLVYIAHPLAGDIPGNMQKIIGVCREISRLNAEIVPVAPLLTFSFLREPEDRELALEYCLILLGRCDELWLAGDWRNSKGCLMELEWARELGMKVAEWVKGKAVPLGYRVEKL